MSGGLLIRAATAADEATIEELVGGAYAPYLTRMDRPPAPLLEDYGGLIARGAVSVATSDQDIVGLIVSWAKKEAWYIDNLATAPSNQGAGIGAALLDWATEQARSAGLDRLVIYTNAIMVESLNYYLRHGFVEERRVIEDGYNRVYLAKYVGDD